jgi:hypothetical protein
MISCTPALAIDTTADRKILIVEKFYVEIE